MARESYRLRPGLADSVNLVLASSHRNLRALGASLKETHKATAEQLEAFPNTLQTIPGIGPVYAAGIYAEIGDCEHYQRESQVARHAGLAWKRRQSGHYEADTRPGMFGANKYLRYYLLEAANSVRRYEPEYRAYYRKKHREASRTPHKRAVLLTARKLVRLIFALLKRGEIYRPPGKRNRQTS